MNKPNTLEVVYDGLLESVRRVDNFNKVPSQINQVMGTEEILNLLDDMLIDYNRRSENLNVDDDDLEIGLVCGVVHVLSELKEKINKGD